MKQQLTFAAAICLAAVLTPACNARPNGVQGVGPVRTFGPADKGREVSDSENPSQRFKTLDEYLAWLKAYAAPTDRAWYREIRPGVYELQTGNFRPLEGTPAAQQRTFTREELERKFGFRK